MAAARPEIGLSETPISSTDPHLLALYALHRGDLALVAQYLQDHLIDRLKPTDLRISFLYALVDLLVGAPNAYHRVTLHPNRSMKRLDAKLRHIFSVGRSVAEASGGGDAVAADKASKIKRSKAYELGQKYRRYQRANDRNESFELVERPSKVPAKRRGRAGSSQPPSPNKESSPGTGYDRLATSVESQSSAARLRPSSEK
jgi:hypothetical protein